jgi:hypothetical protein
VKQKKAHIILSWLLLAIFAFAQLPFSLLHHHTHSEPCALVTDEQNDHGSSRAHFHNYENSECFVCHGTLLKKDYTVEFAAEAVSAELVIPFTTAYLQKRASSFSSYSSSRAPPSVS